MPDQRLETGKAGEERIASWLQTERELSFRVRFHFRSRIGRRHYPNRHVWNRRSRLIGHSECDRRRNGLLGRKRPHSEKGSENQRHNFFREHGESIARKRTAVIIVTRYSEATLMNA